MIKRAALVFVFLFSVPILINADCEKKSKVSLICSNVSTDDLLSFYKGEPYLILNQVVWNSTWNASSFAPLNTLTASNVFMSEDALKNLISIADTHLSVLEITNSKISLPNADFFNRQILATLQLINSVQQLPERLDVPYLRELDLSNNEELVLPVINGQRLTYLNVSGNSNIGNFTFLGELPLLEILDLSYCNLETLATLPEIDSLITLFLQGNRLTTVSEMIMPNLKILNLNDNSLKTLDAKSFAGVKNLESLFLNDNSIYEAKNPFANVNELKTLELSNNELDNLDPNWFVPIQELEILKLNGNKLSQLTPLTVELNSLHGLYLNDNELTDLDKEFFEKLPYLAILNVSNNHIVDVKDTMGVLKNLNKLYIGGNSLLVSKETFKGAVKLNFIDLSDNQLDISLDVFQYNPDLKDLTLKDNNIKVICPSTGLPKQIKTVDIRNNKVEQLGCLRNLQSVQAEGNPLICDKQLQKDLRVLKNHYGQFNIQYIMRPMSAGYSAILDDSSDNVASVYKRICPNGPDYDEKMSHDVEDSDEGDVDGDDDDSDYDDELDMPQSRRKSILSIANILKFKNGITKYNTLQYWITVAYVLLGLSVFVLILNVGFVIYRRRTRLPLASESPYKKLHNDVYKDTTHLVDDKSVFLPSFSTLREKKEVIFTKLGFQKSNRESTDSQARMILEPNN